MASGTLALQSSIEPTLFLVLPHFLKILQEFERRFDGFDAAGGLLGFFARAVADDSFEIFARGHHFVAEFVEPPRVRCAEKLSDRRVIEESRQIGGIFLARA